MGHYLRLLAQGRLPPPPPAELAWQVLNLLALLVQKYRKYAGKTASAAARGASVAGAQFTCFTSTKVQILTPESCVAGGGRDARGAGGEGAGTQFTCFTGTKVQILELACSRSRRRASRCQYLYAPFILIATCLATLLPALRVQIGKNRHQEEREQREHRRRVGEEEACEDDRDRACCVSLLALLVQQYRC